LMTGLVERPLLGNGHGGCGRRLGEPTGGNTGRAPRVDLTGQAAPLQLLPHRTTTEIHKVRRQDLLGGLLHEYQQVA
jgi:hypothetical protein